MPTLRQDLVTTAVRECVLRKMKPDSVTLDGWLQTANVAKSVFAEHGVGPAEDLFHFPRFVAEVARKVSAEEKRRDWLRALRAPR